MLGRTTCTRRWVLLGCGLLLLTGLATECSEKKQPASPGTPPPAAERDDANAPTSTQPTTRVETGPATRPEVPQTPPATRPEEQKPVSTYSSKPPYPVSLFVRDPQEKQPGWLRIDALADDKSLATARGRFPEQNRIYVDTGNVRRLRIHVGHLPLRPNERVILQIDGQGMVISRSRPFTTLELSSTGQWRVVKDD